MEPAAGFAGISETVLSFTAAVIETTAPACNLTTMSGYVRIIVSPRCSLLAGWPFSATTDAYELPLSMAPRATLEAIDRATIGIRQNRTRK